MTNFNYTSRGITEDITSEFTCTDIFNADNSVPVLIVKFAGGKNKAFKSAMRVHEKSIPLPVKQGKRDFNDNEADRQVKSLAKLLAKHIIVGWQDVKDANGKQVPFNQANCEEFLLHISEPETEWVIQDLTRFITVRGNFLGLADEADEEQEDESIKNS